MWARSCELVTRRGCAVTGLGRRIVLWAACTFDPPVSPGELPCVSLCVKLRPATHAVPCDGGSHCN